MEPSLPGLCEFESDNDVLEITPSTKINDLLKAYPELVEVLIASAPPFKKLKNPFLRRGVASIRHISSVGNVPLDELVNKLRAAVGQPVTDVSYSNEEYLARAKFKVLSSGTGRSR